MLLFLECDREALTGWKEFKLIDKSNQNEIISFLLKYENCIELLSSLYHSYFPNEEEPYQGYKKFDKNIKSIYQSVITKFAEIYKQDISFVS